MLCKKCDGYGEIHNGNHVTEGFKAPECYDECDRCKGSYDEPELPKSLPKPPIYELLENFKRWSEGNKVTVTNVELFIRSWSKAQEDYEETVRLMKQTL